MEYRISIKNAGIISASDRRSLLENLALGGEQLHAPCGGNGTCRRCKVRVSGLCRDMEGNVRLYADEEVLACRVYPAGELTVETGSTGGEQVRTDAIDIPPVGEGLGLAVDIGTTTVAAYLYDLKSGKCIAQRGAMNAQRSFGSDVISRIGYASRPEGLEALTGAIRGQIAALAKEMCGDLSKISYVSLAGNTVMEHLLAGLSPESIGVAPFRPLSLFGEEFSAEEILPGFDCPVYICPSVAGYVGGDITAGLLACGADKAEQTLLFIDIGTNGEMALGDKNGYISCATAAGPAFEGAEIECGSPARSGAINQVETDLSFAVMGGGQAESICGSGLIDAVAALLYQEELDETGRLEQEKYFFSEKVYLSGVDIRQLQLAKAAVRAGIETLLDKTGKSYEDISRVLIAGGFGAYMRIKSACAIGLLPPALADRISHVGNSAGKGAALCLHPEMRERLAALWKSCGYLELSSSADFNDNYIEAMMFEEWEDVLCD